MEKIENMWITNPHSKVDDIDAYLNWFDSSENHKKNYSKGYIDFYNRVLTLDLYASLGDPREKNSLEIGFGGGRLINAASKIFKHAYGIDILNEECIEMTHKILSSNMSHNVTLYNNKDSDKLKDKSIDFVYSFIVFQHFANWSVVEFYLDLIDRVLTDDGVGILYFGRNDYNNKDYYEVDPEERGCSLYVKPDFAEERMKEWFEVLEVGEVTKQPWNNLRSGQFYIKFIR